CTTVSGTITTPRLAERVGEFVREGEVIAVVEDASQLEAEVVLAEQEAAGVVPGQPVSLRARSLPLDSFGGEVARLAPRAVKGQVQSTLTVYCRLLEGEGALRPGTVGHARIYTGRCSIGAFLWNRGRRLLRTEFW